MRTPSIARAVPGMLQVWRNSIINHATTGTIALDVDVTLTAIVRVESNADGYSASIPALPGCHTQGDTLDEVQAKLHEAAEGWLAVAHDDGMTRRDAGLTDDDL